MKPNLKELNLEKLKKNSGQNTSYSGETDS